ncbi:hypothetical protein ANN_21709 [Periplaneta americana]|uniref:Uncharacterized protein n=1 Tax=Periplaneta americana TaxID=6978 RepID=A0ABQ8S703_PERAM|nr:hypothetical protein ANN_21709 [Periplaneta americana]
MRQREEKENEETMRREKTKRRGEEKDKRRKSARRQREEKEQGGYEKKKRMKRQREEKGRKGNEQKDTQWAKARIRSGSNLRKVKPRRIVESVTAYLKAGVYEDKSRILDELKDAIRQHITQINRDLLERVHVYFRQRLQQCVIADGHHMPDVISRSYRVIYIELTHFFHKLFQNELC